jgi:hypothetical protein
MTAAAIRTDPTNICIVHAGMIKTGTTSIQSSLFYAPRSSRYRLLTLDSYFGNVLIGSAFAGDYGIGERFISHGVTARAAAIVPPRSREYLERSLKAAADRGCMPILSAEIISGLPRHALARLRAFLADRGWQPRVILYLRAPLDLLESRYQQRLRAGSIPSRIPRKPSEYIEYSCRTGYAEPLECLDEVFGREHVALQWFDPQRFPGNCVVRHFCGVAGIPIPEGYTVRENDSLSLDAVRFIYALFLAGRHSAGNRIDRLHRAVLLERLGELRGPSLRFHPDLTAPFIQRIGQEMAGVEARLGEALPLSLHHRRSDEGVRCEPDLLDFSGESLEWLAQANGRRIVRRGRGSVTVNAVVEQLEWLGTMGSPRYAGRVVMAKLRERWQRAVVRHRNLQ